ncbi:MAG: chemotaxis protein CheW [Rhodospirillales bacterium]|nr:chemotaxis protein CheW [Rhodospirillales bacterium]
MDDLMREFLAETAESLAILDLELVKFEQNPNDSEILMNIFRVMHTIKGTCGFLGLSRLEHVAHAGEDVLGRFRDGVLQVTPSSVTVILACIDRIRAILGAIEERGDEGSGGDDELIGQLRAIAEGRPVAPPSTAAAAVVSGEAIEAAAAADAPVISDEGFPVAAELLWECEAAMQAGLPTAAAEVSPPAAPATPMAAEVATAAGHDGAPPPAMAAAAVDDHGGERKAPAAQQSIRVNVEVLENLMTLVSELVLTRNNLLQMVRSRHDSEFADPLQRLSLITTDLQEGVMKTRMQPVGNAWAKLPRIIRDLAVETGKSLDLQMFGAETEVDRQVLELIKDPLTHMVRNSADHGIEKPHERLAAGKPETGVITLRAYHQGGHIIIDVHDDGRGLDTARIRRKIVDNGLASESELDAMGETEIHQFIFRPGFSTAETVTSVSGRGVGMDVVRTNIERIGGSIELKSTAGRGSGFTIKIPLTLAIVSALIVACGGERFAIPQLGVRELVHVSPQGENSVEIVNNTPLLRLRDRLLPLVMLHDLLRLDEPADLAAKSYFVVVTQVGAQSFGIVVDQVFDTEEIVVKPVARMLRKIPFYSGNTILGDGRVIMILDPNGIATTVGQTTVAADGGADGGGRHHESGTELILFDAGGSRKAVPMALVARLESIDAAAIEEVGGRRFVQYRGQLMPLQDVGCGFAGDEHGRCAVLVFAAGSRSVGLVVDRIIDILREPLHISFPPELPGSLGTAIIGGKATDILDAAHYLTQAFSDWFSSHDGEADAAEDRPAVLVIDHSAVSVNILAPYLANAGLGLATALDAAQAMQVLASGRRIDAVLADVGQPGGDGFAFADAIGADPLFASLPLLAVALSPTAKLAERARAAGFRGLAAKTEPATLLQLLLPLIPMETTTLKVAA